MSKETDSLITVGKITGTHGIKGELKYFPYSGSCESLTVGTTVLLTLPSGKQQTISILRARSNGNRHTMLLEGFDSINTAQQLVGSEITLKRSQLPEPEESEYYWCDLMGLNVITDSGQSLGIITDIFSTGSNDIYVVKNKTKEYLIPAIADVIASVDLQNRLVTITPLDGLLEL